MMSGESKGSPDLIDFDGATLPGVGAVGVLDLGLSRGANP